MVGFIWTDCLSPGAQAVHQDGASRATTTPPLTMLNGPLGQFSALSTATTTRKFQFLVFSTVNFFFQFRFTLHDGVITEQSLHQ